MSSLFLQCKSSEKDSPKHNVHTLHQLLLPNHVDNLDKIHLKRMKGNEFHQRRLELYIPELLIQSGSILNFEPSPTGQGPDWAVKGKNGTDFYIEAICPVSSPCPTDFSEILNIIKKCIRKKAKQYNQWRYDKVISTSKPYVIFIGLYGMTQVSIPLNSHMAILLKSFYEFFSDTKYAHVSAVIISHACDQLGMTYGKMDLFNDMRLFHNTNTDVHLPHDSLTVYQEFHGLNLVGNARNKHN